MLDLSKRSTSSGLNTCEDDSHQTTAGNAGTSEQKHVEEHEQDNSEITSGQEKILKKPDKILPCPRCHSLETKFCYYNNYNVNQPRHFCKKCRRYWTAGGSMRNLPVGSGKRKRKSIASHHFHVVIPSDGLVGKRSAIPQPRIYSIQADALSVHLPERDLKRNGTTLKFKPEGPLCESMSSVLNLGDKNNTGVDSLHCHGKSEEGFRSSYVAVSNCVENDNLKSESGTVRNSIYSSSNGFILPNNMLCFPAPLWTWTWPTGWNNIASANVNTNPVPWSQALASSVHSPPSMPFLFYPATDWGHTPCWPKAMWNLPSSSACEIGCSNNSSPTSGKHSRDATFEAEDKRYYGFPRLSGLMIQMRLQKALYGQH